MLIKSQWVFVKYNFNFRAVSGLSFLLKYEFRSLFMQNFVVNRQGYSLLQNKPSYDTLLNFSIKNIRTIKFYQRVLGFNWFRFVLFSGLGYKRRLLRRFKVMFSYIGDRH